jgi:alkaline phosphatase D
MVRLNCFLATVLTSLVIASCASPREDNTPELADPSWQALPSGTVSRVAFGSCTRQMRDQPVWKAVVDAGPDLFVHLGDAIYPDITDDETALIDPWPNPGSLARIEAAYVTAAERSEFKHLRNNIPIMAVWDDHDYGINDGDREWVLKDEAQRQFLDFFGESANSIRQSTPGIYDSRVLGPDGNRVQVILLDVRYFRSPPVLDTRTDEEKKALNIAGRYGASDDPDATVLGEAQWAWLEKQLREPAEVRLLVSSYPVVPTELGRDAWGNFPLQRQRLFDLIAETRANGVFFLSGDVHFSEISRSDEGPYPMLDFTSSPLAAGSTGNESLSNTRRISDVYAEDSFGLVEIDWNAESSPAVVLRVMSVEGTEVMRHEFALKTLAIEESDR